MSGAGALPVAVEPVIRLKDLVKRFSSAPKAQQPALNSLTADIPSGRVVGLVGPDAAGKTTLMRLLAGLLLPTSGQVLVFGQPPDNSGGSGIRDVGYMPQRFGLYEDLSVLDNLSLHAELCGLEGEDRRIMFEKLLSFTDLQEFTQRLAGKLSGGMKQKLGLACALLTTPRLLLLDEPGVGVDPLSRRELWRMVSELVGRGMSVLWSTAYMDEAERCAHVLMLEGGRLVYQGAPQTFTDRVQGRVFQFMPAPGHSRAALAAWSQEPLVRDALIQGSRIRLVLDKAANLADLARQHALVSDALTPVSPRLEDAYIDAVGGMDHTPSPFEPEEGGVFPREKFLNPEHPTINQLTNLAAKPVENSSENLSSYSVSDPLTEPAIRAVGLTKRFGSFTAACDITFEVRPGQIFGLLGPNGAGKSTTFRMLCGLSRPSGGECYVAGQDLLHAAGSGRAQLGYMAQKFSLYGELTVLQNMRLTADLYGLSRERRERGIGRLCAALGLEIFSNVKAGLLPLGHKQRLAMACATLHDPPVLFLDEPTSGVDPRTRREFWKHINAMTRNGVAVLVTTHFMEEAEYCDEIALIFRGRMIARGIPDDLKARSPGTTDPTLEEAFIAYVQASEQT